VALQEKAARDFPYTVSTWRELAAFCEKTRGAETASFLRAKYEEYARRIKRGELNYPGATIAYMKDLIMFSGIKDPLALISFSPPVYPAMSSAFVGSAFIEDAFVKGKDTFIDGLFAKIRNYSRERFGVDVEHERYDLSLSDISYTAIDQNFSAEGFVENTPLWGPAYSVPFAEIASLNIPSLLLGPHGEAIHEAGECVEKHDLCERIPALIRFAAETAAGWKTAAE
jgi:arginine utilization protein RocB